MEDTNINDTVTTVTKTVTLSIHQTATNMVILEVKPEKQRDFSEELLRFLNVCEQKLGAVVKVTQTAYDLNDKQNVKMSVDIYGDRRLTAMMNGVESAKLFSLATAKAK